MSADKNFFGEIDNVILKEYDKNYALKFDKEVRILKTILIEKKAEFYHIGSTAIPNIVSKPIIDIAVGLEQFPLNRETIKRILNLGYEYWENNPNKNHQFFFKNLPRTHHLHFYPNGYKKLIDQIIFRDRLITDKKLRKEYEQLKMKLAKKYKDDREKYTEMKAGFVNKVLEISLHTTQVICKQAQ